ncbi:MAG: Cache 3/Cache 2 fusion domain-containing protein, partial [Candidatus Kapaibacteriales bacterium]
GLFMGKSITFKINSLIVFLLILTLVSIFLVLLISKNNIKHRANEILTKSEKQKIEDLARLVMNMAQVSNDLAKKILNIDINIAKEVLKKNGEIRLSGKINLRVTNQFTKETSVAEVPNLSVGGMTIPLIPSFDQPVPIIDEITKLTGATATLFVRMNRDGDMLRIATSVRAKDGRRAIQTYIPAVNPNGEKNPVVSTILAGEDFVGREYVVDQWYLTMYTPVKNNAGEIIGMLYVGIPQKVFEDQLRQYIYSIKIGETGYVAVLQGSGENKGVYLISKEGKRDGENIWEAKDASGNLFVQNIINLTTKNPGEISFHWYDWKNPGEPKPRKKIGASVYFKEWDWVIIATSYEDEIFLVRDQILSLLDTTLITMIIFYLVIFPIAMIVTLRISKKISQPVILTAKVAETISKGNFTEAKNLMND